MTPDEPITPTPPDISIEESRRQAARDAEWQERHENALARAAARGLPSSPVRTSGPYQEIDGQCPCGAPAKQFRLLLKAEDVSTKPYTQNRCSSCIEREEAERLDRERVARIDANRARAREQLDLPPLYRSATLEGFEFTGDEANQARQRGLIARAREFLDQWPNVPMISVMSGGYGSGKTHVAWSICRALVEEHSAMCRVSVLPDVIRDLRENWGVRRDDDDDYLSEVRRLAKYRDVDLLVIDEVSRHAFYGQPVAHLYDLVGWREVREKPTIITTNERGANLAEYIGEALISRALRWGDLWEFGECDYRLLRRRAPRAS